MFGGTVDGNQTLTLTAGAAGDVKLGGAVGSNAPLAAFTVTDGAVQSYQEIKAGTLTISDATTSVTFNAVSEITNNVNVTSGGTIVLGGQNDSRRHARFRCDWRLDSQRSDHHPK